MVLTSNKLGVEYFQKKFIYIFVNGVTKSGDFLDWMFYVELFDVGTGYPQQKLW